MSKADKLFKELGFEYYDNFNHDYIYAERYIERNYYFDKLEQRVVIDCDSKTFFIEHGTTDVFEAINRKIKELGLNE